MLLKTIKIIVINMILIVGLSEGVLRLVWENPYRLPSRDVYLHQPNRHQKFPSMHEIYDTADEPIIFNTSRLGFIESTRTRNIDLNNPVDSYALAVGGSTTECSSIQENFRWPDLLDVVTLNFGKSRMHSIHSYYNIKHLLEGGLRPKYIFVMDGVNNLSRYLRMGQELFKVEDFEYVMWNPYIDFIAQNFYLATFVRGLFQPDILQSYRQEAERSKQNSAISETEFNKFLKNNEEPMFKAFLGVYNELNQVAKQYGAQIIILTQPHSYRLDYRPQRNYDFRTFPIIETGENAAVGKKENLVRDNFIDGRRTNIEQAGRLMDVVNRVTLRVAESLDVPYIDTASCFELQDVSELIYDEVHFSKKGSQYFSSCVNRVLEVGLSEARR
ncbi:MAG: hypothetical protein HYW02_06185 [Deltaproteobacteria bacterium]|nr:hypothetical protein [Deltaproteobacteria bacterium]MBI2501042.1 hypothetical protein [Deltaproteobacteria bacterium]